MEQAALEQIRRRLDDDRAHLMTQLADMGVDPDTGNPDGDQFDQGFADSGQSTAEKALVLSMAEGVLENVKEIDAALERIDGRDVRLVRVVRRNRSATNASTRARSRGSA